MVKVTFEYTDNAGTLFMTTHFGHKVEINCYKNSDEIFRLGGTAINDVAVYEGVILALNEFDVSPDAKSHFKAFYSETQSFYGWGELSPELWDDADLHCFVTEYYPLNMEGKKSEWFISRRPIKDAHYLFANLDILDGGGNIVKRYRVSPFTGQYCVLNG